MTKRLEQAFAQASRLPVDRQDELADWLMSELEDDQRWNEQFRRSGNALEKLAAEARHERNAGLTQPLDPNGL